MSRIKLNEVNSKLFYQIPKEFYSNEKYFDLSSDAVILYSILTDRLSLSIKNKWVNNKGEVYLIFTREKLEKLMRKSKSTIVNAFKQLRKFELIEEERQGLRKPNLIFINHLELKPIEVEVEEINSPEPVDMTLKSNIHTSRCSISIHPEVRILNPNQTDSNYTNNNNTDKTNQSISQGNENKELEKVYEKDKKENDGLMDYLNQKYEIENMKNESELYVSMVNVIHDVVNSTSPIMVNKDIKPVEVVKARFMKLELRHLQYVFSQIQNYDKGIRNPIKFLTTCLYNSIDAIGVYDENYGVEESEDE
jgi:hypothetical protein